MTQIAVSRASNRPLVATLWGLTLFALIPFPNLPLLLMGAAANLAANAIALCLLCSRSRPDRVHGFARLGLQVAILLFGAIAIARSGVSLQGFCQYVAQHKF